MNIESAKYCEETEKTYYGRERKNYINRNSRYSRGSDIIIRRNNTCHFCRNLGHWSRDCTWKKYVEKDYSFKRMKKNNNKNIKILIQLNYLI